MIPTDPEVTFYDDPYDPDDWFHLFVEGSLFGEGGEGDGSWRERRSSARRNGMIGQPASRSEGVRRRGPGRRWNDRTAAAAMML